MKIAFVLSMPVISPSNGVVSQALMWKQGLEQAGHEVILVNLWNIPDWKDFDIIQFFWSGGCMANFVSSVSKINPNIVLAPIIDSNRSLFFIKILSFWGSNKLRLENIWYNLRKVKDSIKLYLVRSEYEKRILEYSYNISENKISIVPLSFRFSPPTTIENKEPFCLHVSLLADKRKNVMRIIEAAKKYNIKLILAGKLRNNKEEIKLNNYIAGSPNIEYKGFVSDGELCILYQQAKVFALPSICEGVGLVALDAAVFGCDIVITELGGPKEYYANMATEVDPYNVDEIGHAIKKFIDGDTFQPALSKHIQEKYNLTTTTSLLADSYLKVV